MIVTELHDGQGLGNQLWVYAACRTIAKSLNYPFYIEGKERFKGLEFLEVNFGASDTTYKEERGRTDREPLVFMERLFYDPELRYFSSDFDERVRGLPPFTKISGLFQSEQYLSRDFSEVGRYFEIKEPYRNRRLVSDNVCVLNLRGGEYKRHKQLVLPESYWRLTMENMRQSCGIDKFVCVTDDRRFATALFPGMPVISGSIADCYVALYQAKYLILSNSSFAYFPVKTGVPKSKVIAPMYWARFGNRYSRWASPANLYESWMYQDVNGSLHSHADCVQEKDKTIAYYREHYYLSTVASAVMKPGILAHVPAWVKRPIKKGLSFFFPRHIG
jgi:hypothetical protein